MEGVRGALSLAAVLALACGPQAVALGPAAPAVAAPEPADPATTAARRGAPAPPRWGASSLEEREALYVRLANEVAAAAPTTFTGKLPNWPVIGGITSPFGPRWGGFHNGLDIASPMRTPVRAAAPGQVAAAGRPYLAYGDTAMIVIVVHDPGFVTLYVHLDETRVPPVKVGDRIKAGDVVGYVGLTGWTTGPHVHFMTVVNGRAVDPLRYLP